MLLEPRGEVVPIAISVRDAAGDARITELDLRGGALAVDLAFRFPPSGC